MTKNEFIFFVGGMFVLTIIMLLMIGLSYNQHYIKKLENQKRVMCN